jgi:hypothetical protein
VTTVPSWRPQRRRSWRDAARASSQTRWRAYPGHQRYREYLFPQNDANADEAAFTFEGSRRTAALPKRSYVYAIHVDGVLRYIGKGTNGRMRAHMKEVRQRLTRKFKLKNVSPFFQRKLTEAVMKGAVIEEIVLADNLTTKQAYKLEYGHMERMVYAGNREQLWNAIPPSIYTPQEYQAYIQKLTENLTSKDRWTRVFSRMQLIRLGRYEDKR